ncbi:MAG: hypothetical protein HY819_15980 [Acidobacteria bacterium]|nr:hypothetical protein [Acidobacteriota bacterium]
MLTSDLGATFQIPKLEASAELLFTDNRRLRGKLFLSILPSSRLGHSSVLDGLNEDQKFFPFLSDESNRVEIFNKDFLIEVIIDIKLDQAEQNSILESNIWIEKVEVQCGNNITLTGNVVLDLPPNRARVLDFFNLPEHFFALQKDDKSHIINKKYVTSVREMTLLPPPQTQFETKKRGRTKKKSS